jgi:hypothetical protein
VSNPLITGKNLDSITLSVAASAYVASTAGGSGDNTLVTGLTIDRLNLTPNGAKGTIPNVSPFGAMFLVSYEAALAAAATLSIVAAKVEDSADGTTWATIYDITGSAAPVPPTWPAAGVVDTGGTGGSTQRGVVTFMTDIKKARRYVRFDFTPDLSATGTDTGKFIVSAVLSGIDEVPPGVY